MSTQLTQTSRPKRRRGEERRGSLEGKKGEKKKREKKTTEAEENIYIIFIPCHFGFSTSKRKREEKEEYSRGGKGKRGDTYPLTSVCIPPGIHQ